MIKHYNFKHFHENNPSVFGVSITHVKEALGKHYEPLHKFYGSLFFESQEYEEIVFIVRRSLLLCELFFEIYLTESSEAQKLMMFYSKTKMKTDSHFLSHAKHYCNRLEENNFPSILLVDELVIQGDSISEIMSEFEANLWKEVEENLSSYELYSKKKDEYLQIISDCIQIKVALRGDTLLLLNPRYQFYAEATVDMKTLYDFSNRIGLLINDMPLNNCSYLLGLRENKLDSLPNSVGSFYKAEANSQELSKYSVYFFNQENPLPIRGTVRILSHRLSNTLTVLPQIFMPDLSVFQYHDIKRVIHDRWEKFTEDFFPKNSRGEMEAVHFFLNFSLLRLFYVAKDGDDFEFQRKDFDDFKLSVHYHLSQKETEALIQSLLKPGVLLEEYEFTNLMESVFFQNTCFSQRPSKKQCNIYEESAPIAQWIASFFYKKKIDELECSVLKQRGFRGVHKTKNTERNFSFQSIWEKLTKTCPTILEEDAILCWLLQYIDRGILTLNVKKSTQYGSSQFLRTGEGSIFLYPKKYYQFNQFLHTLEESTLGFLEWMEDDIHDFLRENEADPLFQNVTEKELIDYVRLFHRSNQAFHSWSQDLFISGINYTIDR